MDVLHIVLSLLAGIGAGFLGAVTGGGGLLSIPALIFIGLPVDVAIATNRFSAFGIMMAALPRYYVAKKIDWKIAAKLVPIAILGGFVGSKTLTHINTQLLSVLVGVLLLLMIPVVLLNSNMGLKQASKGKKMTVLGHAVFFLVMIYGGFFGGGVGMFAIYTLIYFLGITYIEANATNFVPWTFLSVTALLIFLLHGLVNFELGIPMMVGMYIGGALGAKTILKRGNAWARVIFVAMAAASSIKLLFF